ncbi:MULTISPECIES: alcohol dehydrogenase [Pseudomonas]|uniref:Zinc-containing alcohol dehydrogenase super protein n=3 Tax=Pseudomonas syringae group genomosp. 2 TaxID=251698 RepID=A0AAX1VUT2_PSEAJ|nr:MULTISPECIES: alcohol dehydrogenase [Pseudomonas syringae group genomosp. 2]KPX73291.1 Zinc-containing alcohol dehydrogenase superfamily protein [Pseudomonas amygdali pv. lachrymans]KIY18638.1 alcohol dehydrogenase [Pseudomonas amygdali pv. tabaci]KPY84937.1 Mechanosensitive ion channel family protein [Pseudomonas amygdali pv. tabaci]QOI05925.1 alcohol dehydrogenase [Pseudomonas savastanoi]RML80329.1 Zinc-containing alcohol dehydrogenase super protein [Pseudomonas amygdali pv. tabaci]
MILQGWSRADEAANWAHLGSGGCHILLKTGAVHVIAALEQDLVAEVNRMTDGKGARMAFDQVGGPEVVNILRALPYLDIFFQYGALETADLSSPVMEILSKESDHSWLQAL